MTEEKTQDRRVNKWIPWLVIVPFVLITTVMVLGQGHYKLSEPISGSFSIPKGVKTVTVTTDVGNVEVFIGPPGKVEFEGKTLRAAGSQEELDRATAVPFTLEVAESADPTVLVVRASPLPSGFLRLPPREADETDQESPRLLRQMDVRLRIPVDLAVDLLSSQGNIRVDTRQASTSVTIEKGDLMLQHIAGSLTARNGEGTTIVDQHRGQIHIRGNGKTRVSMAELNGEVDIISDLGEVDVLLPPHSSATIDAQSLTGNVRNSFGFQSESKSGGTALRAKMGDGAHTVRLIARKGTLTLTATKER